MLRRSIIRVRCPNSSPCSFPSVPTSPAGPIAIKPRSLSISSRRTASSKEQLGGKRLRLTNDQRRRLAAKGKSLGRPGIMKAIRALIVRMATDNSSWGYCRIQGELRKLNHCVAPSTIAKTLKEHGIKHSAMSHSRSGHRLERALAVVRRRGRAVGPRTEGLAADLADQAAQARLCWSSYKSEPPPSNANWLGKKPVKCCVVADAACSGHPTVVVASRPTSAPASRC